MRVVNPDDVIPHVLALNMQDRKVARPSKVVEMAILDVTECTVYYVPVPDSTAPANDCNARPVVMPALPAPGDHPLHLVPGPAPAVRQEQRTRALGHHRLLLETVQHVQVHRVGLVGGREAQDQDHSRSAVRMSSHHLPPPGLPAPHREVLLRVLHVEDRHVEEKLRVTGAVSQAGPVIMNRIL